VQAFVQVGVQGFNFGDGLGDDVFGEVFEDILVDAGAELGEEGHESEGWGLGRGCKGEIGHVGWIEERVASGG
jgi:hypothetical protein